MRSLLDENLNLQRRLREVTVEVEALRENVPADEGDRSTTDQKISTADCADFKWENRRLKDLLEKQTVDMKELRRLVGGGGERKELNRVEDVSGPSLKECAERLAVKTTELEFAVGQVTELKRRNLELEEESRCWEKVEEQRRVELVAEQRGIVAAGARVSIK